MFDDELDFYEDLNHLIGDKNEQINVLPEFTPGFEKNARKRFNRLEERDLIEENWGATASNFAKKGDVAGTHYEKHNKSEIAQMMPKGL